MRKLYLYTIVIILSSLSVKAQWKEITFNNCNVTVLKKVNNVCFAYGIDNNSFQGKLYRSDNNGSTWKGADSVVFKFVYVRDITYDSAHSNFVICTNAQNGIFVSANGNTWTSTGIDLSGDGITYINNQLVLTTANPDAGVCISTNGGYSFFSSNSGLVYPYYVHYVTRINNTLYLSMQGTNPCYISNNGGASWTPKSTNLTYFTNCFYKWNGKVYAGLYLGRVKKYNSGTGSWTGFNQGLTSTSNIWSLAGKTDSLFCGGDTIGVWVNTNNVWTNFSSGLPAKITVRKLLLANNRLFAATANGLWKINLSSAQGFDGDNNTADNLTEKISINNIKIFPTVTTGKLNIQSQELPGTITLINENGQVVKTWSNAPEINISNVPAGNYFIILNIKGKQYSQQVIKIN